MSLELLPGTLCAFGDRVIQIDGVDSLSHVMARDMASGQALQVEIAKLRAIPQAATKREIGFIDAAEWKRCADLARDLMPWREQRAIPSQTLLELARKHHLSVRQLQRLRVKFARDPRASVLAREAGGRPAGHNALAPPVHRLIHHVIQKHYFRRERPAKIDIVERVRSLCRRLHYAVPSPNAIVRRIDAASGFAADAKRLGRRTAKQRWEARPGSFQAAAALDVVQIDHTLVDVMVVSDDRQTVLGRPWISLAIDVHTRVVVGMYLTMDAPSIVSVSLCIEHAVLPKPEEQAQPGTWPMYGKPRLIHVDNGKDLRSHALKRGCEQHGMQIQWRPVRTPHYGAHIERLNGTLMRLCHLLPGTTFSNPKERGDYDSQGKAIFTLDELQAWLVEKICRYYHVRRHSELGLPPAVAWTRAFTDAQGQVRPPPLVASPEEFRVDFLPFEFRKVHRTGIELRNSRYWHEDLTPLLRHPDDTMVRYDPRDDRQVFVRLKDGRLVRVPAIAGRALGAPARRIALDAATQAQMDEAIDAHFDTCDALEAQAALATRRARTRPRRPKAAAVSKRRARLLPTPTAPPVLALPPPTAPPTSALPPPATPAPAPSAPATADPMPVAPGEPAVPPPSYAPLPVEDWT